MADRPTRVAAAVAALTETLTRPRFHTHCGETHVPGPCNDGELRLNDDDPPEHHEGEHGYSGHARRDRSQQLPHNNGGVS